MPVIERMKISEVPDDLADEREQLARQAMKVLGYKKLAEAITLQDTLTFALRKLHIEPLVRSSVEEYKTKKARNGMWSEHKKGFAWFALSFVIGATLFAFVWPWLVQSYHTQYGPDPGPIFSFIFPAFAMIFTTSRAFYLWFKQRERGTRTVRKWIHIPVQEYLGNIPEFALAKAVQIKAACPLVSLYVDALHEERHNEPVIPMRDPFLVATLGVETYYIDVWDEREYEARL